MVGAYDLHHHVCGFEIVRIPDKSFDLEGRVGLRKRPRQIDGTLYSGIDRMEWFDVKEELRAGTLPSSLQVPLRELTTPRDFTGIHLCTNFEVAEALLERSNAGSPRNEMIAVRGTLLAQIKGAIDVTRVRLVSIGFDVVELGFWSLLAEGLFLRPDAFPLWKNRLNAFGLLSTIADAQEFAQEYRTAMRAGLVEELPGSVYGTDAVEVFRVPAAPQLP